MSKNSYSLSSSIPHAWNTLIDNINTFAIGVLVAIFYVIISAIISFVFKDAGFVAFIISLLYSLIVGSAIELGWLNVVLSLADAKKVKISDFLFFNKGTLNYIVATIISSILVFLGLLLFIIPGIYIGLRLSMFRLLIVDKKLGIFESLSTSWKITEKQTLNLFVISFIFGIINLYGLLTFGIGLLITAPLTSIAIVYVYKYLLSVTDDLSLADDLKNTEETA